MSLYPSAFAGGLSRKASHAEQRELLIDAFTRTAAERGYAKTSAEEVARRAGVSTQTFHAHFPDMRRCLSAAHDDFVERLAGQAEAAVNEEAEWADQVRTAVAVGVEFLVETASRARVFAVDAVSAGPVLLERHYASVERVAGMLRRGRERYPRAASLPGCTESILVGGIVSRIRAHLLAEEAALLPLLEPEFVEVLLTPYLGVSEAKRIARTSENEPRLPSGAARA